VNAVFIGHFGVGLALKRVDKALSLGFLFIAVQLPDLIYGVALLTGVERIKIVAGTNPLTSAQYVFYPYSHGLVATLLWAGLVAGLFLISPLKSSLPKARSALIMGMAVLSHFLLDVVVHNPDMDLLGNGAYKVGLGLWNFPLVSYIIEAVLLVMGLWIYLGATKSVASGGKYGLPVLGAVLLVLNAVSTFGSPPTTMESFALRMLAVYLGIIVAAFWLDRKRS